VVLTLAKGRTVHGRVVDVQGKPVAGASISVASWNNLGPLEWSALSDADGRFAWDSAPREPTVVRFSKPGFEDAFNELPPPGTPDWPVRFLLIKFSFIFF
jgi:hypothetical protein